MLKRKLFLLMIFLVASISISAAFAAEDATENVITTDTDANLEGIGDEAILNELDEETTLNEGHPIGTDDTFGDLDDLINKDNPSTVNLDKDYRYFHGDIYNGETFEYYEESQYRNGIEISHDITIYGKGHTIDGQNISKIFRVTAGKVTIINVHFINANNSAVTGGDVTVRDCTFLYNHGSQGGAMHGGTAINCIFIGNTATQGGAIYEGASKDCRFTENSADDFGGAIYNGEAINCIFTGNTATSGGAVYYGNSTNCTFTNNTGKNGGATFDIIATGCNFTGNTATNGGAAYGGDMINCIFNDNQAVYKGGAAYRILAKECIFLSNKAHNGGALYGVRAEDCIFESNIATSDGGAAYGTILERCNFTVNMALNDGGAVSGCVAQNCLFTKNNAPYGGAMEGSHAESCTFTENTAPHIKMMSHDYGGYGGAIYNGIASDCKFTKNNADNEGGAISRGSANNCEFQQNQAPNGGALSYANATDCKFIKNNAYNEGGAIYNENAYNCIFTANTAAYGGAISRGDAYNCTFKYNLDQDYAYSINQGRAILCIFDEDQFNPTTATAVPTYFIVSNMTAGYNANHKLKFNLTAENRNYDGFNTTIVVYENGVFHGAFYVFSGDDGGWTINLEPGTYNVTFSIPDRLGIINASIKLIVLTTTELKADDMNTTYNTEDYLTVTLTYDDNKKVNGENITVDLDGIRNYTVDSNGQIKVPTKGLSAGTHAARISFEGDEDYLGSSKIVMITVSKDTASLTANEITAAYNINNELVVTLKDSQGNPLSGKSITVNLNGAKTLTTDKNGQVKVSTAGLAPNAYTANIVFAGNANYTTASKDVKVTVKKATPKLTAKKKTFKKSKKTKKYTVTLKDNTGKAMKKVQLTLKIGKKTYKAKTNAKGKATFKIKKSTKKDKYNAVITYKGDNYYNKITKKVKIIIK